MRRISPILKERRSVVFEGQCRFAFLKDAAEHAEIASYKAMLVDCDDETRTRRLSIDRGQPDLANADMMNWASFLRKEAILDTSKLTLAQAVDGVLPELRR